MVNARTLAVFIPAVMFAGIAGAHYGTATAYAFPCVNDAGAVVADQPCRYAIDYDGSRHVYVGLPDCEFEDGNPDGEPCLWTSKRTGFTYYVDSSNYRQG